MMRKYIIGIDVGFKATGISIYDTQLKKIVKAKSVFTPDNKKNNIPEFVVYSKSDSKQNWMNKRSKVSEDLFFKSMELYKRVYKILNAYNRQTIAYIIEVPAGGAKSSTAARAMGLSTGIIASVIEMMCIQYGIVSFPVTNMDVKRIVGKGAVTKKDVIAKIQKLLKIRLDRLPQYKAEHIADACACIIHGLNNIPDLQTIINNEK